MISLLPNSSDESSALDPALNTHVRVLVVEPDAVSRRVICTVLEREADVKFQCIDNSDVVEAIQDFGPDLVIVDTQNPVIRRATNWEALGIKSPVATIVTSYDRASLIPFASAEAKLLIKPFNVEEFENALEAARSEIACVRAKFTDLLRDKRSVDRILGQNQFLQRFAAEFEGKIILIKTQDILWLQSFGNYIRVHSTGATHLVRNTMRKIQPLLDPSLFLRIHRNAIVNLDHVVEFFLPGTGNMFVKLDNGASLPIRRSTRASLRKFFKQNSLL
jgi:two-component system, LytTR family, response regulator